MIPTEELIRRVNQPDQRLAMLARECLSPGERVRMQFGMALRQVAAAMEAQPPLHISVLEMLEYQLEAAVNAACYNEIDRLREALLKVARRWPCDDADSMSRLAKETLGG